MAIPCYYILVNVTVCNIYVTTIKANYVVLNYVMASGLGLKVGRMTWTIWVTILVGQVGLIHKLIINYLDMTQISHVL